MKRILGLVFVFFVLFASSVSAAPVTIYSDTFAADDPADYDVYFGAPEVTSDETLALNTTYFEQIIYDLSGFDHDSYQISFDVEYLGFDWYSGGENFSLILDTPKSIEMKTVNKYIYIDGWDSPIHQVQNNLPVHFDLNVDFLSDEISIFTNGILAYTGLFEPNELQDIRFSLAGFNATGVPTIKLDNIVIIGDFTPVPVVSTILLFGSGIAALLGLRRKVPNS